MGPLVPVPQGRAQVREQRAAVGGSRPGHPERLLEQGDRSVQLARVSCCLVSVAQRVGQVSQVRQPIGRAGRRQRERAAQRADRTAGNYTVLQNGVYTACEACKNDPKKPPLWQVRAARIIHDQSEKMLYFEDARVEFFGVPLAWVPFMSAPDPTVKRKSGFLFPTVSDTTQYGFGVEVPYYWALAPNADITVSTMATTRQGELFQGEWRHRLMDGAYSIKGPGPKTRTDNDGFGDDFSVQTTL